MATKKNESADKKEDSAPQQTFRMVAAQAPVDDSFADGVGGFTVGRNVLKLDLYRVVGLDQEKNEEVRTHSHRLVLPLTAIPELQNVLRQFDAAVKQLRESKKNSD